MGTAESVNGSQRPGQIAFRYIGEYRGSIIDHACKSWSSSPFGAQKPDHSDEPDTHGDDCLIYANDCDTLWSIPSWPWDSPLIPVTPSNTFAPLGSLPQSSSINGLTPWSRHQVILIPSDSMECPTCLANLIPSFLAYFCWFLWNQVTSLIFSPNLPSGTSPSQVVAWNNSLLDGICLMHA